jgi:hypothetical protein
MNQNAVSAKDASPLDQALHRLDSEIAALIEISGKLESKLSGVMRPSCPTPDKAGPSDPAPAQSAVTSAIQSFAGRIRLVTLSLEDVASRTEV